MLIRGWALEASALGSVTPSPLGKVRWISKHHTVAKQIYLTHCVQVSVCQWLRQHYVRCEHEWMRCDTYQTQLARSSGHKTHRARLTWMTQPESHDSLPAPCRFTHALDMFYTARHGTNVHYTSSWPSTFSQLANTVLVPTIITEQQYQLLEGHSFEHNFHDGQATPSRWPLKLWPREWETQMSWWYGMV